VKQGTVSVLVGCHSPVHSVIVVLAWKKLYGKWPTFKELVCIFLHDIGHWGLDYLDDVEQKNKHWRLGAQVAEWLFGIEGYRLCAGHCRQSGMGESKLYRADKYSWHIAPFWWVWLNNFTEPKIMVGYTSSAAAVRDFKARVKESVESGSFSETHKFYLERRRRAEETV